MGKKRRRRPAPDRAPASQQQPTDEPAAPEPAEIVQLAGLARPPNASALHVGELTIVETGEVRRGLAAAFELELEGGHRVWVETAERVELAPRRVLRETWAELEQRPEAEAFRARAPAPHVDVELVTTAVCDGDAVSLRAEVLERAFEGGTMRDAPVLRVTRVRALALAVGGAALPEGERPDALVRAGARGARSAPLSFGWALDAVRPTAFALLGIAALGLAVALGSSWLPRRADGLAIGVVCICFALGCVPVDGLVFISRRGPVDPDAKPHIAPAIGGTGVGLFSAFIVMLLIDSPGHLDDRGAQVMFSPVLFGGLGLASGAAGIVLAVFTRASGRLARVMLAASPHAHPRVDGQWGASVGKVTADKPPLVLGELAPLFSLIEDEFRSGSSANVYKEKATLGSFVLDTAEGGLPVDAADGLFASTIVCSSLERVSSVARKLPRQARIVGVGSTALVVGRMSAAQGLAATGPESLLVFASEGAPRRALARLLLARNVAVVSLLFVALALGVLSVWHPFLGDVHLPDSGD